MPSRPAVRCEVVGTSFDGERLNVRHRQRLGWYDTARGELGVQDRVCEQDHPLANLLGYRAPT